MSFAYPSAIIALFPLHTELSHASDIFIYSFHRHSLPLPSAAPSSSPTLCTANMQSSPFFLESTITFPPAAATAILRLIRIRTRKKERRFPFSCAQQSRQRDRGSNLRPLDVSSSIARSETSGSRSLPTQMCRETQTLDFAP